MKTRILAIVPYIGLKEAVERVAASRDDVSVTAIAKNLEDATAFLDTMDLKPYDVILSRGGTADCIKRQVDIPVVEIALSGYDILSAIRSASMYSDRYAIVGFPSITRSARLIMDIIQEKADIYTIESKDELRAIMDTLKLKSYNLIVGDVITISCAQEAQLNAVLFTSGESSVMDALDQAVRLCQAIRQRVENNELLNAMIAASDACFAAFDKEGKLLHVAGNGQHPASFPQCLASHVSDVFQNGEVNLLLSDDEKQFPIQGKRILYRSSECALFHIHRPIPLPPERDMWLSTNISSESYVPSLGFQNCQSPAMQEFVHQMSVHAHRKQPLWITGEAGTGKDFAVKSMHTQSDNRKNTIATIDARFATAKRWSALLESTNSPLCCAGISLYIKNAEAIDAGSKLKLIEYINQTQLHRRNQLYISWELPFGGSVPLEDPLYVYVVDELDGAPLLIPPLRERLEDLPSLIGLFLNGINLRYGKQIIGLTEEAFALLRTSVWPRNLSDVKRLLNEAVLLTDTPYITEDTVARLLNGSFRMPVSNTNRSVSLDGTLYDITQNVIQNVLYEENNNQLRTAQRLGISRGTLWKRLKEMEGGRQA